MENKYEKADQIGRDIIISLFPNIQLYEGGIEDVYDLSGSTRNNFYIEVKNRPDLKSTSYDTDILEYHKLSNMRNIDRTATHFYAMIFNDGIVRIYNLKEISIMDVYLSNLLCPVSNLDDRGFKEKLMIDLPVSKAKTYRWKDLPC